jgi:hypothetical protein
MPYWLMQLLQNGGHNRFYDEHEEGSDGSSGEASDPQETDSDDVQDAKTDDKPKMSESEAKLLKESMKRKARIKELEQELTEFKSKLTQFDGIDPDSIKQLLKEREDAEKTKLEQQGNWNALKEKMAKEHQAEKEQLKQQIEQMQQQFQGSQQVIEKLTLSHQFDSSKFISDELVLTPRKAKAVYGSYFDIDEQGHVIGYDKPRGESNRTQLVDGSGDPLPFDEAMKRLIEVDPDRDELLKAKRRAGAGSSTTPSKPVEQPRQLSSYEKIELGLKSLKK